VLLPAAGIELRLDDRPIHNIRLLFRSTPSSSASRDACAQVILDRLDHAKMFTLELPIGRVDGDARFVAVVQKANNL
jgi:hypothetical protein